MIQIDELLIGLFFIWIFYDSISNENWKHATFKIFYILSLSSILVIIPYIFGSQGKIIMYAIFGVIAILMVLKNQTITR